MAQSSNRFGLDEINTQLTAPTSNVQVQGPLNTNLTTSTRSSGIKNFTDALGGLARKTLANKIHNDTVDAQLAAAYGKEQPKGLEPEAVNAFNYAVDLKEFDNLKNVLANHAILEGNEILNNDQLSRKDKLSMYQRSMQANINTALQAFTPSNYPKFAPLIDEQYSKYSLIASTELAKQKKEEESSINAAAITANVNIAYDATAKNLTDQLAVRKDGVGKGNDFSGAGYDSDLSPKEFAKLTIYATNLVSSKGLSVSTFNTIVNQTLSTGVGADNRETKATVLAAMAARLLKAADEGDFTVDPKILSNLIDKVKGNPQAPKSTLRTEITGTTPYSTIFKTIEDKFTSNLKTLLTNKRTAKTNAVKDADNQIGNELFDNVEKYTQKQGQEILEGMNNITLQLTSTKKWNALFTDVALNGSTSLAYVKALIGAHKAVLKPNGREIDETAFAIYTYEHKLKTEAAKALRAAIDPESKIAKHRTSVLENKSVVLLLNSFKSTTKAYLQNLNVEELSRIANGLEFGQQLPDKLVLSKLRAKLGSNHPVFNKAAKILNAELDFTEQLETLILNNPNKEPIELAKEAKQMFDNLFADVVRDQPLGTTATDRDIAIIDNVLEKRKLLEAASGAVTLTTSGSGAVTLKEVTEKKQTALTIALKEADNPENLKQYAELATKEVELAQKAMLDEAQFKVKTRAERMSIMMEKGGIPTATDAAKRTVAAFETNPDAFIVLRAKALQDKSLIRPDKNAIRQTFAFEEIPTKKLLTEIDIDKKLKAHMERNRQEGKELFSIGDFQLTTDDAKKAYGNVKYYLKGFYDIISDADTPEEKAKRQEAEAQASKTTVTLKKTTGDIRETKEPDTAVIRETKEPDTVSSAKPKLSVMKKVASAINEFEFPFPTATTYGYEAPKSPPVKSLQKHFPNKPHVWSAMVATMKHESSSFNYKQEELSGKGGYGLFQFTGPQRTAYNKWIKRENLSDSEDSQVGFVKHLIYDKNPIHKIGPGNQKELQKVFKTGTPQQIMEELTRRYVKPGDRKTQKRKAIERGKDVLKNDYSNLWKDFVPTLDKKVKGSEFYPPPKAFKKAVNVGATSLPKVQGEIIEDVAKKSVNNPEDGLWDFEKDAIRPMKDIARASLNTVPMHLRFVIDYVKDNKLLGGGEQEVVTERHMTPEVVKVLKTAIQNAKKRGLVKDSRGFWRVEYKDYPMTKSGISVQALFQAGNLTGEQATAGRNRWGASFGGVMRMIGDSFDPVVAGSGTFGAFGFKEVNGEIIIEDVYDFSKFKGEATTAYSAIRKWISTEQGDKTYKTVARLGKIEKNDLV